MSLSPLSLGKFGEFWAKIAYFWLAWDGCNHFVSTKFSKLSKETFDPSYLLFTLLTVVVLPLEIEGRGDEGGGDGGLPQDIRGTGGHSGVSQGGRMQLGNVHVLQPNYATGGTSILTLFEDNKRLSLNT